MTPNNDLNKYQPKLKQPVDLLVFDMDGTLICQDSFVIQMQTLALLAPIVFLKLFIQYLVKGRVYFKRKIFEKINQIDVNNKWLLKISINEKVMNELRYWQQNQGFIIVATGSYYKSAERVLSHINVEPKILIATNQGNNLTGLNKLDALELHIKDKRWAYFGDSKADRHIFKISDESFLIQNGEIIDLKN